MVTKKIIKCNKRRKNKPPKCESDKKCVWDKKKKCISVKKYRNNKKVSQYIKRMNFNIQRSTDKTYNARAVAKALRIKSNLPYTKQCMEIIYFLEKRKKNNPVISELLNKKLKPSHVCDIMVNVLYNLLQPEKFPIVAPISISADKYKELILKHKQRKISRNERKILNEALNIKYCFCVKKLYLKFLFEKHFLNKAVPYSEYGICLNTIYKKRKIKPPKKIAYKCKEKYYWFRNS